MNWLGYLNQGYDVQQVLSFISRTFPNIGYLVRQAEQTGKSAEEIFRYLSNFDVNQLKKMDKNYRPTPGENPLVDANEAFKQPSNPEKLLRTGLKTAAGIGLGLGAMRAAPAISNMLPRAMGADLGNQLVNQLLPQTPESKAALQPIGPSPMSNAPVAPPPISPASEVTAAMPQAGLVPNEQPTQEPELAPANVPEAHMSDNAEKTREELNNSLSVVRDLGLETNVLNMLSSGADPEAIAETVNFILKGPQRKWFGDKLKRGEVKPLIEIVKDIQELTKNGQNTEVQASQGLESPRQMPMAPTPNPQQAEENPVVKQLDIQDNQPLQKGDIVSREDGLVGEVKSSNGRVALIEDERGKIHQVPVKEIEKTPEEIIQTVQNLLKIPEVDKSSVVSLFTYDPEDQDMYIQFHNGETYRYKDVDPDKIHAIANKMGIPVTEGKNIFGAWSQEDRESLGATLIKEIIRDPKYAKSEEGKTWRKLETAYDYWKGLRKPSKRKKG